VTTDETQNKAFERHAQTGLVLLVVALLAWVGLTVNENQIKLAELSIQVQNLNNQVAAPTARVNDLTRRIELIEEAVLNNINRPRSE
jgi:outer membrane murein-binding lipoprotein Lpp